ncbi:MAG TPA: LysR family transcriptional regulator substrate-binding protein [Sphingorhabdus sp.]|nr:LysR family transcriptional regulator substrate-binding protein [Sphingorhabdus sp.]
MPYFETISSQVQAAREHAMRQKRMDVAQLRIAAVSTIGPQLLSDLLMNFRNDHPTVEFDITGGSPDDALTALREGKVDVALVAGTEETDVHFNTIKLSEERLVVVVSPNHLFAARNAIGIDDLDGHACIHQRDCQIFQSIERLLEGRNVALKKVLSSGRDDWVLEMVRAEMGFAIMPESSVNDPCLVVRQLVEPEAVRNVVLATARGRPHSPAVSAFVAAARANRDVHSRDSVTGTVLARRTPRLRLVQASA